MSLVVQKYGGSSVATASKIVTVASRIARTQKEGAQVAVVVSAMGDTTNDLIKLAHQVCSEPSPRGVQGANDTNDVTTLGRGGSDTTAVALAAALGATRCEIYTDVDGIFTADPRVVPEAVKLDALSYEEMLELASYGAKMHPRSIEMGAIYNVPILVASSANEVPGTLIHGGVSMEISSSELPSAIRVTQEKITTSQIRITCIISRSQVHEAVKVLHKAFQLDQQV